MSLRSCRNCGPEHVNTDIRGGLLTGILSRSIEVEDFQEEDFQPSKTENDNSTSYVPPTEEEYLQLLKRIKRSWNRVIEASRHRLM